MCGIAGKISLREITAEQLRAMTDTLIHRGPDAEGLKIIQRNGRWIGLGHRRLKIIDLSDGANQPFQSPDENLTLVFNGEIYNFRELQRKYFTGENFRTHSDTEVILKMHEKFGADCVKHFRGQFALAIYDKEKDLLFLARDQLGKKPLYYYFNGAVLVFASRVDALLTQPEVQTQIDFALLDDFLAFNYIPADVSAFKNIYKLPAGHTLSFGKGQARLHKYWDLDFRQKINISFPDALLKTAEILREAVNLRLIADVPLGAHLSGGLDSSLITALLAEQGAVKTFSIGFSQKDFSELSHARLVADYLGTEHQEFIVTPDAIAIMPELIDSYDEPNADPSQIPMYYLCRLTRQKVTVALGGDGGDECFGGYERYAGMLYQHYFRQIPRGWRQILYSAIKNLPETEARRSFLRRLKWLCKVSLSSEAESYWQANLSFDDTLKNKLYTDKMPRGAGGQIFSKTFSGAPADNLVDRMLYHDTKLYLNYDLLVKADRSAMRHSLEGRAPFLDVRLIEFAASLPAKYKIHNFQLKYLLKKIAAKYLPREIIYRKKQGFGVPLNSWFRNELKQYTEELFSNSLLAASGYFQKNSLLDLLSAHQRGVNHGRRLFTLAVLENWLRKYQGYI
ncbi:MAG: asparagine synthase (glutamine-hydrolyzing) [Candidatus Margulisbacteria bacterium]|jgi:asparagine synthase (glutamine-hydrolysing)|nr:asparagine synthase (glutamine-hydrolyzing) [Candidatus Margulisiibacteriota bacterium]